MPTDRLDKDVELMQKAGISVVRVGESTWSTWEPRGGAFQFAWMQWVLDKMQQAGIKVIRLLKGFRRGRSVSAASTYVHARLRAYKTLKKKYLSVECGESDH